MRNQSRMLHEDLKGLLRLSETLLEIAILTVTYYSVWRVGYDFSTFQYLGKWVLMGVYALLMIAFFQNSDCTKFGHLQKSDLVIGQWIALLLVNVVTYLQHCLIEERVLSVVPIVVMTLIQMAIAVVCVIMFAAVYQKLYAPQNIILVYGSKRGVDLKIKMDARRDKYNINALVSIDEGFDNIVGKLHQYDAVILNDIPAQMRNDLLKYCYQHEIRTYVVPKLTDLMIRGARKNTLFDTPLLLVKGTGLTPVQRVVKRTMDIVMSVLALIPASVVMAAVAVAIKAEDGGPVFYKQKRLTRGGREFEIIKFRSMIVDAEKYTGAILASEEDPRITRVGRFIRATRLDELPQLLNILKGDMSIVGPRPERKVIADEYCKETPEFAYRLKVRSGLTGYAQIYGKYNTNTYNKLRMDLIYIEKYSLSLDIKLIICTLRILFSKKSTEGIDKAAEDEKKVQKLLEEREKLVP